VAHHVKLPHGARDALGIAPLLVLVAAGCANDRPPESAVTIDTLPSGVIHVRNVGSGAWREETAWHLADYVEIGMVDGEGPAVFGDVRDVGLDAAGRVYMLDFIAQQIQVFGPDGSYVRTIGRPGQGPGEFGFAVGMRFDPAERLWVLNQANQRYSLFDTSGALLKEFPRRLAMRSLTWPHATFTAGGSLYDWLPYRTAEGRHMSGFARYDTLSGRFVDTLGTPALPVGTALGWGYSVPTARGWWMGVATEYRFWQFGLGLDTVRIVERDYEQQPLPGDQRDSVREAVDQIRASARGRIDMDVPRYQRIFDRMIVDDRGYLWILLSSGPAAQKTTIDVFDPEGRYLGGVETPYRVEPRPPPVIRGDRIAFVTKDSLDVARIVTARIQGRD